MSLYDFYGATGLHRIYNNHGMRSLDRGVNIPDAELGIGVAELTAPVPLLVAYKPIMKMPDIAPVVDVNDTFVKTQGAGLDVRSFVQTGYVGEAIGGF